jgi:hypothetical protein
MVVKSMVEVIEGLQPPGIELQEITRGFQEIWEETKEGSHVGIGLDAKTEVG